MILGLIGQKCGMTRVFLEDGQSIPVTVVKVTANHISQVKTVDNDGYSAVQVTAGTKKASHVNKALTGHFAKAKVEPGRGLWEFRLPVAAELKVGESLTVEMFENQAFVDVTSTSIGKGFAGVIKRHNFSMQDATHGNSLSHRAHGSTGQCQDPGRVFKGKKMAGQLGNKRCTVQNQQLVKIDKERELLFIKGTVPGSKGSNVTITPAVKKTAKEESK